MKTIEELDSQAKGLLENFRKLEKVLPKDRMAIPPQEMPSQEPEARRRNTGEVALGYTEAQAVIEANRCLQCPGQPCRESCPVKLPIRDFVHAISQGDFKGAIQLIKEQSIRNVIGVRVPQQNVKANPSNLSADGALRAITRAIRQYRVLPFESIGTYDADTMLDTVEAFADEVVKAHGGLDDLKIYLNKRHQRWYIRAYREKYGKDADFTGANAQLVDLDPASLVWVPNMKENDFIMFAMEPGNIELLENKPGEMLAFDFTPEFEGVAVKSRWKEGSHATKAGAPFKSEADLKADNFEHQFIFVNNPASALTIAAAVDLRGNTLFTISQAAGESPATAITTATGVATDRVITFVASAAGVTLEKSGVFSKISANFVAGAKGDYIEVYPELEDSTVTIDGESVTVTRPTGKLLELGRKVTA